MDVYEEVDKLVCTDVSFHQEFSLPPGVGEVVQYESMDWTARIDSGSDEFNGQFIADCNIGTHP